MSLLLKSVSRTSSRNRSFLLHENPSLTCNHTHTPFLSQWSYSSHPRRRLTRTGSSSCATCSMRWGCRSTRSPWASPCWRTTSSKCNRRVLCRLLPDIISINRRVLCHLLPDTITINRRVLSHLHHPLPVTVTITAIATISVVTPSPTRLFLCVLSPISLSCHFILCHCHVTSYSVTVMPLHHPLHATIAITVISLPLPSMICVRSETQRDVLSMMDSAAGFMNDTLNDVLSMSKIEGESWLLNVLIVEHVVIVFASLRACCHRYKRSLLIVTRDLHPPKLTHILSVFPPFSSHNLLRFSCRWQLEASHETL